LISVCLATYNGEKFIGQQLVSILEQLRCFDELILVDDCSLDSTLEIVDSFSDSRLKVYRNDSNAGVNSTFSKAISCLAS
jgi:glycosyltransferase involved in cell wall biosynthesis